LTCQNDYRWLFICAGTGRLCCCVVAAHNACGLVCTERLAMLFPFACRTFSPSASSWCVPRYHATLCVAAPPRGHGAPRLGVSLLLRCRAAGRRDRLYFQNDTLSGRRLITNLPPVGCRSLRMNGRRKAGLAMGSRCWLVAPVSGIVTAPTSLRGTQNAARRMVTVTGQGVMHPTYGVMHGELPVVTYICSILNTYVLTLSDRCSATTRLCCLASVLSGYRIW